MKTKTVIEYILAGVVVLILGGLSGWYFFLRGQSQTSRAGAAARGYGATAPMGNAGNTVFGSGARDTQGSPTQTARPPQLWHVQSKPVAGLAFIGTGKDVRLRYVERATGYVFEADPETGNTLRLSNTLLPKIYEAQLTESRRVIERSLDEVGNITTFIATISTSTPVSDTATSTRSLPGLYLAKNITQIVTNPKSDELFYLVHEGTGVTGVRSQWNGSKQKTIFTSSITHWRLLWLEDGRIILAQAASGGVPGYAYELKADGTLDPLLRATSGLTILPRSAPAGQNASGALLWGESAGSAMALYAQATPNTQAVLLPIKTVADKCVWQSGKELIAYCGVPQTPTIRNFLDDWYRGAIHSSDAFWRVEALAGSAELVYSPAGTSVDVTDPIVDSGGDYVAFINATDRSLWLLRLNK